MKLLKVFILFFLLTVSPVSLQANVTGSKPVVDLELFLQPLHMTSAGLLMFFEHLYNSQRYTQDFFPNNISHHLGQFLAHGKETQQTPDYTRATFSLFGQKLKGCLYISAYSFADFMRLLPDLVDYLFVPVHCTNQNQKIIIKEVLYQEFLNNFNSFKENPSEFFDKLSDSIVEKTAQPDQISLEPVRASIIRFIELCCAKLLWDATDKDMWKNIVHINDAVVELVQRKILVDHDDINDIAWSVVHRLCYFLDIVGTDLPLEVYESIRDGVTNTYLFNLEEQEEVIETKRHLLERIILDAIAKKHAQEYGVIAQIA